MARHQADEFYEWARKLMDAVRDVTNESFQKVLYLVMIDGLSSMQYRQRLSPSERFVRFVRQHARWQDGERVSLPQAKLYIEIFGRSTELLGEVVRRLNKWTYGQIHYLSNDPRPSDLRATKDILRSCQHFWLLWALRNSLIHAFRHPAFAHDGLAENGDAAFYHGEAGSDVWRLAYPAGFVRAIAMNCLEGFVGWLRAQANDPVARFESGLWVDRPTKDKRTDWQRILLPTAFLAGLALGKSRRL